MSPSVIKMPEPSPKRRRVSENTSAPTRPSTKIPTESPTEGVAAAKGRYDELASLQDAQIEGDTLALPTIRGTLDKLTKSRLLSDRHRKLAQQSLQAVKAALDDLTDPQTISVDSATVRNVLRKAAKGISTEALFQSDVSNLTVECLPPEDVKVVGSFLLAFTTDPVVDVAVQMPTAVFQSKDYLNYRYHDKRLLYLIYLARHFQKSTNVPWQNVSLTAHPFANDAKKPTLTLQHPNFEPITMRIIPTHVPDLFNVKHLQPDRRNLRPATASSKVSDISQATPEYNYSIVCDANAVPDLQALHAASRNAPNFVTTILAVDLWAIRLRLNLSKYIIAALLADLLENERLPRRASREHALRAVFNAIANGLLNDLVMHTVPVCAWHAPATLRRAQEAAANALQVIESKACVDDPWYGVIPSLFATARGHAVSPLPLATIFDGFVSLARCARDAHKHDEKVTSVLQGALVQTGRVRAVEPLGQGLFGLTFESHESIVRKVDTRPSSVSAEEFKTFWGDKTSLRRFKDGTITEALVWSGGAQTLREMLTHVFARHFEEGLGIRVHVGELERAARLSDSKLSTNRALAAFNELSRLLRGLESLPLTVRDVHATGAHLRGCGMFGIRPNVRNVFAEALEVVMSFSSSKAWPDSPVAISASKAAFYLALKNGLAEMGVDSRVTISYLDVELSGVVFRLRLAVEKERELLAGSSEGDMLELETVAAVRHHDNMRNMASGIFGVVCRLAKRWLNAHFLYVCLGRWRDVVVELLVAAAMLGPCVGCAPPKSVMLAFSRWLHLVADFPWEVFPVVVSMREEGESVREADAQRCLALQRALQMHEEGGSGFGVFAARGEAVEAWSGGGALDCLEAVLVSRLQATARAGLWHMERNLMMGVEEESSLATLFKCDVGDFDVRLRVDESACVMHAKSAEGMMGVAKGRMRDGDLRLIAGLDPVERLCEVLTKRLGRFAVFLHSLRNGCDIFVVWRPVMASGRRVKFALREAAFCEAVGSELSPSVSQLVEEILVVGEGLIIDVDYLDTAQST